jgi:predicted ATPase/class 3 adenylate cyclase
VTADNAGMPRPEGSGSLLIALPSGTLTFLISDIEQSTQAWDRHPASMRRAMEIHDAILEQSVARNRGRLVELGREGDSILAVFTRASEAIACALDAQLELDRAEWPLENEVRVRIALHTGEAEMRDGHYFGPALYRCARLIATAHGGQTILSAPTHDLVIDSLPESVTLRDLGVHRLRDLSRPERVFQLVHPLLQTEFPSLKSLDVRLTNLPVELTSFLGREAELSELKQLIEKSRLTTISGAGGLGKTRIALHLAADLIDDHPDGVWLVELAALSDPSLVVQAVAKAVGVREVPGTPLLHSLTAHLQTRTCLVVLDNCEHLVEECALVSDHLLANCSSLTILATSRERLGAFGELLWRLAPLSLPPTTSKKVPPDDLMECESARLFVDRAWPSPPGSEVDEQRSATILQICRRLDGIPLAIELAAARAKVMTLDELLERLDDRFRLLTGGGRTARARQQTLRATVDWSYQLLDRDERTLFRRLSVFAGGFAMADVEAVCSGDGVAGDGMFDILGRLVDKSLTMPVGGGDHGAPMRMLETLQQYSRERLVESGEAELYLQRHAQYFAQLAESAKELQDSREHSSRLDRLEDEHDNLRAALDWSQKDSAELNFRLVTALVGFWDARGYLTEGRDWLEKAVAAWPEESELRAETLGAAGWMAHRLGDFERADSHLKESIRIARAAQRLDLLARSLRNLALVRLVRGQSEGAGPLVREAIGIARDLKDRKGTAGALLVMALVAYFEGDHESALIHGEESLALHRSLGDEKVAAFLLACLATLAIDHRDEPKARANLRESLRISRELHEKVDVAFVLESCALLAASGSEPLRAFKLAGAAASVRETVGAPAVPRWSAMVEASLQPVRAAVGPDLADIAWGEGRLLSLERAIDQALDWLPA